MATISSAVAKLDKLIIRKSRVIDSSLASTIRNHIGHIALNVLKRAKRENAQLKQEILNIQGNFIWKNRRQRSRPQRSLCVR